MYRYEKHKNHTIIQYKKYYYNLSLNTICGILHICIIFQLVYIYTYIFQALTLNVKIMPNMDNIMDIADSETRDNIMHLLCPFYKMNITTWK